MMQFHGDTRVHLSVGGHVLVYGSLPRYRPSYVGGANKHTHQKYQTIDDTILELCYNVFYSSTKSARGGPRMGINRAIAYPQRLDAVELKAFFFIFKCHSISIASKVPGMCACVSERMSESVSE